MLMHLMFACVFQKLRPKLKICFDNLVFCEFHTLIHQILAADAPY